MSWVVAGGVPDRPNPPPYMPAVGPAGASLARVGRQIVSGVISIAPHGHSAAHSPQPLQ